MRIDYSEPKKSYVTPQGGNRPRRESGGSLAMIVIITGAVTFALGFGTGWYFSQKAAKKSFQAALEQTSLESSKKQAAAPPPSTPQQLPQATQPTQPAPVPPAGSPPQGAPPGGTTADPPLSFYKALPSGQKSTVLGSGINARDDHGKGPLQAPIPANAGKPAAPADAPQKSATDKPVSSDKGAAKTGDGGFTVQISSYPLKSEAEAQKSKLASKGYHVYIVESNQGDKGVWYRVRVGKKLEHDAAKELAAKLGKTAMVIPDRD